MSVPAPRSFLLGPTASGKTAVALALAPRLGAEILSMDSMLVYRGMDLGTAKPTLDERAQVPHHLLDLVEPSQPFSVARWVEAAEAVEADLVARNCGALYVGGTNLYLKAVTAGLMNGPEVSEDIRVGLRAELKREGGETKLREELLQVDPASHQRIHPRDHQRLLRALEVWRSSGKSLSSWQQQWQREPHIGAPAIALDWPRDGLRARVEQRFAQMIEQGLLDEISRIRAKGGFGPTAGKALGYRQLLAFLDGHCSLEEAIQQAVTLTRTYIRRQMTWLRSFPDLRWIPMVDPQGRPRPLNEVVDHAEAEIRATSSPKS